MSPEALAAAAGACAPADARTRGIVVAAIRPPAPCSSRRRVTIAPRLSFISLLRSARMRTLTSSTVRLKPDTTQPGSGRCRTLRHHEGLGPVPQLPGERLVLRHHARRLLAPPLVVSPADAAQLRSGRAVQR